MHDLFSRAIRIGKKKSLTNVSKDKEGKENFHPDAITNPNLTHLPHIIDKEELIFTKVVEVQVKIIKSINKRISPSNVTYLEIRFFKEECEKALFSIGLEALVWVGIMVGFFGEFC